MRSRRFSSVRRRAASPARRRVPIRLPRRTMLKKRPSLPIKRVRVSRRRMPVKVRSRLMSKIGKYKTSKWPKRITPSPRAVVYYRRRPWRRYSPRIIVSHSRPLFDDYEPISNHVISAAQSILRRQGLGYVLRSNYLIRSNSKLVNFINRYYRVEGFEHVVRLYFQRVNQRSTAKILIKLTNRLTQNDPQPSDNIRFYQTTTFDSNGDPKKSVILVYRTIHYFALPWTRIYTLSTRKLLSRMTKMFDRPTKVRIVFDRARLPLSRANIIHRIKNLVFQQWRSRYQNWYKYIPNMIRFV